MSKKIGKNRDFLRQKQKKIQYLKFETHFGDKKEQKNVFRLKSKEKSEEKAIFRTKKLDKTWMKVHKIPNDAV